MRTGSPVISANVITMVEIWVPVWKADHLVPTHVLAFLESSSSPNDPALLFAARKKVDSNSELTRRQKNHVDSPSNKMCGMDPSAVLMDP